MSSVNDYGTTVACSTARSGGQGLHAVTLIVVSRFRAWKSCLSPFYPQESKSVGTKRVTLLTVCDNNVTDHLRMIKNPATLWFARASRCSTPPIHLKVEASIAGLKSIKSNNIDFVLDNGRRSDVTP